MKFNHPMAVKTSVNQGLNGTASVTQAEDPKIKSQTLYVSLLD